MATNTTSSNARTLLTLPGELQNKILSHLEPLDLVLLRTACQHFRAIIPPLDITGLLAAEFSDTGRYRDLYACSLCLCLRHSSHFADSMKKKRKGKFGTGGSTRFCVDCGLNPPPGQNGYCPGNFVTRNSVVYVLCFICRKLGKAFQGGDGTNRQVCVGCRPTTFEAQEIRRRERERLSREQEEREQRRVQRRELWGSDAEDTDEDDTADVWNEEDYFPFDPSTADWRDFEF